MTITLRSLDHIKTALHMTIMPGWTWDDFYGTVSELRDRVGAGSEEHLLILDFSQSPTLYRDTLTHFRQIFRGMLPEFGLLIIVGNSPFVRAVVELMVRTYPQDVENLQLVPTLADAYMLMRRHYRLARVS